MTHFMLHSLLTLPALRLTQYLSVKNVTHFGEYGKGGGGFRGRGGFNRDGGRDRPRENQFR